MAVQRLFRPSPSDLDVADADHALAAAACAPRLVHLDVHSCRWVSADGLAAAAKASAGLMYLDVSFCTALTDGAVLHAIGRSLPFLRVLRLRVAKKADATFPLVSAASICAKVPRDLLLGSWRFDDPRMGDDYSWLAVKNDVHFF